MNHRWLTDLLPGEAARYFKWWRLRLRFPSLEADKTADVCGLSKFEGPNRLYAGARVWSSELGAYSYLGADAMVIHTRIGRFTSIAPRSVVGGGVHPSRDWVSTAPCFFSSRAQVGRSFTADDAFDELPLTRVGNDVWLGYGAIILPGVSLGDGCIVAAGSVVTKNVPPYALVAGVPASIRRYRFSSEQIEYLLKVEWWNWKISDIESRASWFRDIRTWEAKCKSMDRENPTPAEDGPSSS